jgi:hypothetical protein
MPAPPSRAQTDHKNAAVAASKAAASGSVSGTSNRNDPTGGSGSMAQYGQRTPSPSGTGNSNTGLSRLASSYAGGTPTPRQNPLSDTSKFTSGRDRLAGVNQGAISRLVSTQEKFGQPLGIRSGYRDPAHNAQVGGAKHSQHIQGNAVDLSFQDDPMGTRTAELINAAEMSDFGGIGGYRPGSVHVDVGPERQWGPDYTSKSIRNLPGAMQTALNTRQPSAIASPVAAAPSRQAMQSVAPMAAPPTPQMQQQAMRNVAPPRPQPQQMADAAPSFWENAKALVRDGIVKTAYDKFTDANQKINAVPGGGKTVSAMARLAQALQGGGDAPARTASGNDSPARLASLQPPKVGKTGGKKGLANLPKPKPGFTWVQWAPGQPPVEIPKSALIQSGAV